MSTIFLVSTSCARVRRLAVAFMLLVVSAMILAPASSAQTVVHAAGGGAIGADPEAYRGGARNIHFSAGVGTFIGPLVTVQGVVGFTRLGGDAETLLADVPGEAMEGEVTLSGGAARIWDLLVEAKLNAPAASVVSPYVLLGFGATSIVRSEAEITGAALAAPVVIGEESLFGPLAAVGVGVNLIVSDRMVLLLEGRFHQGLGNASDYAFAPIRFGFAFR